MTGQELETYVDAAAAALGLELGESRPGVLRYFALASGFADLVQAVPLVPQDESSMAFIPVEPGDAA
ncbi:AtzG-like protein [Rhodoferax sp.]|uniref:AtzG-like protein n=1 Tax=Rhodoferax sp. TaxID=50421 RepID=UPI00374D5C36